MTDEELIKVTGNREAATEIILERYKPLVKSQAALFYLAGGDEDDLIQEGMIGLFKAVRDYDGKKNAGFAGFAKLCVRRQIVKAIEASNRKKHAPLNSYISFDSDGDENQTISEDVLAESTLDPERLIIEQEQYGLFEEKIKGLLSPMESQVFDLYLGGMDYVNIAGELGRDPKSIDNALQRIRAKIRGLRKD